MPLERSEVEKIAHLARLELNQDEVQHFVQDLSKVLELIEQMNGADTGDVPPMAHPLESMTQRMREDSVTETNQRDLLQQGAPALEAGLYLVPKVIDSE